MKKPILALLLLLAGMTGIAQNNTLTSAADSDPKAKALLDQIRDRYTSYQSLGADFKLDITFPDQPTETQKGSLAKDGKQFRMSMASQTVISDGKTLWMVFDHNKEVQVNNMPEETEMGGMVLSPESFLNFYDQGNFVYHLTNEYRSGNRTLQQIEFKPLDRNAEYTKLRMEVDKATKDIANVEAFGRDGSRYKLTLLKLDPNKRFPAGHFAFKADQYPGYYVEDLRY